MAFNPLSILPRVGSSSSFGSTQCSPLGPFLAPNGALYQAFSQFASTGTMQLGIQKSIDGGATWTVVTTVFGLASFSSTDSFLAGTKIYVLFWDLREGFSDSVVKVFDTAVDSFAADITGLPTTPTINNSGAWGSHNARFCMAGGLIYLVTMTAVVADGLGNQQGRIGYSIYNGSSWSAFTLVAGQTNNLLTYEQYRLIVTPGGNVYLFLGITAYNASFRTVPFSLAYSRNFLAPVPFYSSLSLSSTAANEVCGFGCIFGAAASKIIVPFLGGGGSSGDDQAPLFGPAPGVLAVIITSIDGALQTATVETVDNSAAILGTWDVYETLLACVSQGETVCLTGMISTQSGSSALLPPGDTVSVAGNSLLWFRRNGTWSASAVVQSFSAPLAPSGAIPIVAGGRLHTMYFVVDTSSSSFGAGFFHEFDFTGIPIPGVGVGTEVTLSFDGMKVYAK